MPIPMPFALPLPRSCFAGFCSSACSSLVFLIDVLLRRIRANDKQMANKQPT
ncbi:hypothetical protein L873DRAFT_1817908 [Choiromyces venosus 120613-1]|uniref:Uncharacterized protein n=1 Tax=Choiromyces venosus 120613-1 TaxID=1336337 RepID=A0A3N4JEN1_9PEZI|nr:hypothetical protein L873DRAFT_1817908 [Choiromyces venosus 120613-1]